MFFENLKKIKALKAFLQNPSTSNTKAFDLLKFTQIRSRQKEQKYQQAFYLYLDMIVENLEAAHISLFKELFSCLLKCYFLHHDLYIPLFNYLLNQGVCCQEMLIETMRKLEASESLKILYLFLEKYPHIIATEALILEEIKIQVALQNHEKAQSLIVKMMKKIPTSRPDLSIDLHLQDYLCALQTREKTAALEKITRLKQQYPKNPNIEFHFAKHMLVHGDVAQGEALFLALLKTAECSIEYATYYISYLFSQQHRQKEAIQIAHECLALLLHTHEQMALKLILAWHAENFLEGYRQFENLLQEHDHDLLILDLMLKFSTKHQESALVLELKAKINAIYKELEESVDFSSMFLNLLENTSPQTQPFLFKNLKSKAQDIEIPADIQSLLTEITHDMPSGEGVYLVGGAVLNLLQQIESTPQDDVDLIYVTNKNQIPRYVPSSFVRNLYVRDTRLLGGKSVDLMRIPNSDIHSSLLEENACLRDFTICAIFCDHQGHLYDPTGRGLQDFELKRLDTIIDAKTTLLQDPVRIIRAFKYIARGFKPSHQLEEALFNLPFIDLSLFVRFNRSLLKECHSPRNIDFIRVLQRYHFLPFLAYCEIPSGLSSPVDICNFLSSKLYTIKLLQKSLYCMPPSPKETQLENPQKEMLSQKVKYLEQDLELKNIAHQKIDAHRIECQKDLAENAQLEKSLTDDILILNQSLECKNQQVLQAQKKHAQHLEKQQKIRTLQARILQKRENTQKIKESLEILESQIQEKVEESFEKMNQQQYQSRSSRLNSVENMIQIKHTNIHQITHTQKKIQQVQDKIHKTLETIEIYEQKTKTQKNTMGLILKSLEEHFDKTPMDLHIECDLNDTQFPSFYFENMYALEQMTRVVSNTELRAYLHAHVVLKELQLKPIAQNAYKICNHLRQFSLFLPAVLKSHFEKTIQHLLEKYSLPLPETCPQKLFTLAHEAFLKMHVEQAIYYYHVAIERFHETQKGKKGFYDAYLALADIYLKNHDLIALDNILYALLKNRDLPQAIAKRIEAYSKQLLIEFGQFEPIVRRQQTLFGFQDFWVLTLSKPFRVLNRQQEIKLDTKFRNEIFFEITEKTMSCDEYLLALMEYAFILNDEKSKEIKDLQWQQILKIPPDSSSAKILHDFALHQCIPRELKDILESMVPQETHFPRNHFEMDFFESFKNQLPKDLISLNFLIQHSRHPSFKALIAQLIGTIHLNQQHPMLALHFFEIANPNLHMHPHAFEAIQTIHQQFPQIHWDSCDANGWYQLGKDLLLKNQKDFAIYCFYQCLRIEPRNLKATMTIFEIYYAEKNYTLLIPFKAKLPETITFWSEIKKKDLLSAAQIQEFNILIQQLGAMISTIEQSIDKRFKMYHELLNQYRNNLVQHSNLFTYFDNIDYTKEKLLTTLCWSLHGNNNQPGIINYDILKETLCFNLHKKTEYALLHFELAINCIKEHQAWAIYHFKEACQLWPHLSLISLDFIPLNHCDITSPERLRKYKCFILYDKIMNDILKHHTRPSEFIEHFKFLIGHRLIYKIQEQQLKTFIRLEGVGPLLKFEALLLLDEYQQAQTLLENEINNETLEQEGIFNWPATKESMNAFLQKSLQFYDLFIHQIEMPELKMQILSKLIKLATYFNDREKMTQYQQQQEEHAAKP